MIDFVSRDVTKVEIVRSSVWRGCGWNGVTLPADTSTDHIVSRAKGRF